MSHQSGIKSSSELESVMQIARSSSKLRSFKICIDLELLKCVEQHDSQSNFESDYDSCVRPCLIENQCCYILVRLDSKTAQGYFEWALLMFSPDRAPIRDKMLYASTKATLKQLFGNHLVKDDIYGTTVEDLVLTGYQKHLTAKDAPPPLTQSERELMELKKAEIKEYGLDRKTDTLPGISFPIQSQLMNAFQQMKSNQINYIQMGIDVPNEQIILTESDSSKSLQNIINKSKVDQPRYHFINHYYEHEGQRMQAIVFYYTMPGYSCSVKERMLYSSCKGALTDYFEKNVKPITKKIESNSLDDLTDKILYEELHPPVAVGKVAFNKPRGPGRR